MSNKRSWADMVDDYNNDSLNNILDVSSENMKYIDCVDSYKDLKLYHYNNNFIDSSVNNVRGIIVENDNKIVCKSFPYTPELIELPPFINDELLKECKITLAYEGTLLRVFYYDNEWIVSTHKKINALQNKWGGPTFEKMLKECMNTNELSFDFLNKNYCYVFLMHHIKNTLVSEITQKILFHLATYDENMNIINESLSTFEYIQTPRLFKDLNLQSMVQLIPNYNYSKYYSKECGYSDKWIMYPYCGLMIQLPDGRMYKYVHPTYIKRRKIRGNQPSLYVRYLELDEDDKEEYINMFPSKEKVFQLLDYKLNNIVEYLYEKFDYRYIQKNYLRLPKQQHILLENVLEKYTVKQDKNNIINIIKQEFDSLSSKEKYYFIKSIKMI